MIADFVVDGVKKIGDGLKSIVTESISAAAELKASQSQFAQTFGELSNEADVALSRVTNAVGAIPHSLDSTGSAIYAFARTSGASTTEAMELMETALVAAADSAAYYDTSIEQATETLQSFLKGNFANDAALGLSATEATRNAKAMELFGEAYNKLSEVQKQQTLLKMVTDAQELSGAMGQAARESDSLTNVTSNLSEITKRILADIGEPILDSAVPALQEFSSALFYLWNADIGVDDFLETMSNAIKQFIETFTGHETTQWLMSTGKRFVSGIVDAIVGALPTLRDSALMLLHNFGDYIRENLPELISVGLSMVQGVSEKLRENVGLVVDAAIHLAKSLAKGFADSLPAVIEKVPGIVSNIANTINDNAPKVLLAAGGIIKTLAKGLIDAVPVLLENIPAIISAIWDTMLAMNWLNLGTKIVSGIGNGIKSMVAFSKTSIGSVKDAIVSGLKDLPNKMLQVGKEIVRGIADGIKNMGSWLKNRIKEFAVGIVDSIKSVFDIHSPSGVMRDEVGKYLAQGIGEGFTDEIGSVSRNMQTSLDRIVTAPDVKTSSTSSTWNADVMAEAIKTALNGAGVYMDGKTVGRIVTGSQENQARASGLAPAFV